MRTIVHTISGLSTGGAERTLLKLLDGGLAQVFRCHVLSLSDEGTHGDKIRALGVPVHTLNLKAQRQPVAAGFRLRSLIREISPHFIQGWMYHGNLAASLSRRLSSGNPKLVWNIRHSLYDVTAEKPSTRRAIAASRWLSKGPETIVYNSRVSRGQHEKFGFESSNGCVIPNGFDLMDRAASSGRRDVLRTALRIPSDAVVIGHVARFHPMKEHIRFVRVAVNLLEARANVRVVMAGRSVSVENGELADLVPESLMHRFCFLGERDDVSDLMQCIDVFCLSSKWGEGFPNVLGEAMSVGVPCVTTNVGDSAAIVGDAGIVVEAGDDESLKNGLARMLDLSVEERRQIGRLARMRIEDNYAIGSMVRQYLDLYERLSLALPGRQL